MTPEIREILKKISTAKGLTAILVVVFLSIFIWRNLDFLTEISFTLTNKNTTETKQKLNSSKDTGVPELSLGDIILPPSPSKLPSVVVFEIKNPGSATVNKIHASIDYGSAKVLGYEIIGLKKNEYSGSPSGQSVITVDIKKLRPNEGAYVYAQTTFPAFKQITVNSKDVNQGIYLTYNDYIKNRSGRTSSTFNGFLYFLLGGALLAFTIFFSIALMSKLYKWMKLG